MEIHETVVLRYRNGTKITVPTGLLQIDPDGKRWLRLRASNVNIASFGPHGSCQEGAEP